jgi:hypothetical protein
MAAIADCFRERGWDAAYAWGGIDLDVPEERQHHRPHRQPRRNPGQPDGHGLEVAHQYEPDAQPDE